MKETLEEAALRLYPKIITDPYNPSEDLLEEERNIFIIGGKWQAERMYSEEEVLDLLAGFIDSRGKDFVPFKDIQKWLEQFKKKYL
jgi:hypothetical protein